MIKTFTLDLLKIVKYFFKSQKLTRFVQFTTSLVKMTFNLFNSYLIFGLMKRNQVNDDPKVYNIIGHTK